MAIAERTHFDRGSLHSYVRPHMRIQINDSEHIIDCIDRVCANEYVFLDVIQSHMAQCCTRVCVAWYFKLAVAQHMQSIEHTTIYPSFARSSCSVIDCDTMGDWRFGLIRA